MGCKLTAQPSLPTTPALARPRVPAAPCRRRPRRRRGWVGGRGARQPRPAAALDPHPARPAPAGGVGRQQARPQLAWLRCWRNVPPPLPPLTAVRHLPPSCRAAHPPRRPQPGDGDWVLSDGSLSATGGPAPARRPAVVPASFPNEVRPLLDTGDKSAQLWTKRRPPTCCVCQCPPAPPHHTLPAPRLPAGPPPQVHPALRQEETFRKLSSETCFFAHYFQPVRCAGGPLRAAGCVQV